MSLSPSAKRVAVEARGDIFTVPAKNGTWRNLTDSPGVREKTPAWSPDGKSVAYWSDRTGEYQLCVRAQDGSGKERQVTNLPAGFEFDINWSPDSKKLAFSDQKGTLYYVNLSDGKPVKVDRNEWGDLREYRWSPDSQWIAYTVIESNGYGALRLYSLKSGRASVVTDGSTNDSDPTFDPEGKYLFFAGARHFNPDFGNFDDGVWLFTKPVGLFAVTLAADTDSPNKPQSDEETPGGDDDKGDKDGKDGKDGKGAKGGKGDDAKSEAVPPVKVDLEGLGTRIVELPVRPGPVRPAAGRKGEALLPVVSHRARWR